MAKLKDELHQHEQAHLSLNFILADYCGEVVDKKKLTQVSSQESSVLPDEKPDAMYGEHNVYFCGVYHKHISRTFDIGKCRKDEGKL
jgi:hypothetical protein